MTTVRDLFKMVNFDDVKESFARLYPEEVKSIPGFYHVYLEICNALPVVNQDGTIVDIELIEDEVESFYHVYGRCPGDNKQYGLDFTPFKDWASFYVSEELLNKMELSDIVAHILWEATFYGYTDEAIQKKIEEISARTRELNSLQKE